MLGIVGDNHTATAKHIARAHKQRKPYAPCHLHGLVVGLRHAARWVGDVELVEQRAKALAVLG